MPAAYWQPLMLDNKNPHAEAGCTMSNTGLCKDCPHWRCMPVDVSDPTTGDVIKQGTVWDCVFAWAMLGSWDAGRQSQGVHAAVNSQRNEATKRQDEGLRRQDDFFDVLAQGLISHVDTRLAQLSGRLESLLSLQAPDAQPRQPYSALESDEQRSGGNGEDHQPDG